MESPFLLTLHFPHPFLNHRSSLNRLILSCLFAALSAGVLPLGPAGAGALLAQNADADRDRDLERADKLYGLGQLGRSIQYYERGLQRQYDAEACARLAMAHRQQGNYGHAEHWFRQAVLADYLDPLHYRTFAEVLRANGKAQEALEWFERYDRYTVEQEPYREDYALAAREYGMPATWRVQPLAINSRWREIAPAFAPDGGMLFASDRPARSGSGFAGGETYFDVFRSSGQPESSAAPSRLKGQPNGPWHDAGFVVDPLDGSVWFTRTASVGNRRLRSGGRQVVTAIYRAEFRNGKLRKPERFAAIRKSWVAAHPSFSPDGRRLYFSAAPLQQLAPDAALRETQDQSAKGHGGFDIWYCERQAKRWGKPVNAGALINTAGNESWPFSAGPDRLYLASDGHPGLGGLDLFVAERSAGRWTEVRHLPAPMSSPRDDFALVVRDNQGWFASDRLGGQGRDDLYAFERVGVEVLVRVVHAQSGQPVAGVQVECFAEGTAEARKQSDARGEARFAVQAGQPFYLSMNKQGFEPVILSDTRDRETFTVAMQPVSGGAGQRTVDPDREQDAPSGSGAQTASPSGEKSAPGQAQASGYRIRIGVYRNPDLERLQRLERFGTLMEVPRDGGARAFYLGMFPDAAEAAEVLARVRVAGFTDAFVEQVLPRE